MMKRIEHALKRESLLFQGNPQANDQKPDVEIVLENKHDSFHALV